MWGLEVRGASGVLQIDQDYANLHLVKTATVTLSSINIATHNELLSGIIFTEPAINPIIAFRANVPVLMFRHSEQSPGVFTQTFASTSAPGGALTYYLFDRAPAPQGGWGLEVYDPDGGVAFTSNRSYFRVAGSVASSNFGGVDQEIRSLTWLAPDTSKTYAAVQSQLPFEIDERGSPSFPTPRVKSTALVHSNWDGFLIQDTITHWLERPATDTYVRKPQAQYLFVDVTGY